MKQRQEFNVGETVTFLSCGDAKRLPATVRKVMKGAWNDPERVQYELVGLNVLSITSGKSILESEYCVDQSKDYTGQQVRTVDGNMATVVSDWLGEWKDKVQARFGETIKELEICDMWRIEQ